MGLTALLPDELLLQLFNFLGITIAAGGLTMIIGLDGFPEQTAYIANGSYEQYKYDNFLKHHFPFYKNNANILILTHTNGRK